MAAPIHRRVLVYFQKTQDAVPSKVSFLQPLVDLVGGSGTQTKVALKLEGTSLVISKPACNIDGTEVVTIKRPTFCPVSNLTDDLKTSIPEDIRSRGVDVGAVTLVETAEGKVLLIRRPVTQRTFPGIWVPPGGHVEENETLREAGLRELYEETGLNVTAKMCDRTPIICAWESVYPPMLSAGLPRRHHAVVYMHVKLKQPYSAEYTTTLLKPDPREVGEYAWLDRNLIKSIVATDEEIQNQGAKNVHSDTFRSHVTKDDGSLHEEERPVQALLNKCTGEETDIERVSTGTKHALKEWLAYTAR